MKTHIRISERHSKAALLASTTAILILVLAGVLFAAGPDAPRNLAVPGAPATLTGSLHTLYGDAPGGGHMHTHMLVDDKGQATELEVPDSVIAAAGGRTAINRRRVTVRGQIFSALPSAGTGAASPFKVSSIAVESAASSLPGASPLGAQALVSGSQKWVSILCRFADSPTVPQSKEWIETLMLGGTAPGLDHYWREASFGTVNLTGSVVVGWYKLPQPRSYYVYGNPVKFDMQRATNDCTGVADADVFFPNFIGVNLMFSGDLDCCAWGGSTNLSLDGQSRLYRMTWLPPWAYENQGPVAHEMGHGFGLPHSSGPYGQTYDSRWDVMSDVWGNCPPNDPIYGCVGTHTISYHKDLLGWIPSNRRYVAALGTSETITLEPLDQVSSSGYMIARIPLPGSTTRFYTVETRRLAGYDAKLPGHAVIIHLVDPTRSDRDAQVVDPDANGDPDDASAMWLPGEAFVDSVNGISVSVLSATSQGFVVTVSNGVSSVPASYTLSMTVTGPGTVTSNPAGIACSAGICSASFPSGTGVTLTTSSGTLTGWGGACSGTGTCSVTMAGNRAASAAFSTAPNITAMPIPLAYGAVAIGLEIGQKLLVRNDGTAALVLGAITIGGVNPNEFFVVATGDLCSGHTLAPGESCKVPVRFRPTTLGSKTAQLQIPSNDPDEPSLIVKLKGTGVSALPK